MRPLRWLAWSALFAAAPLHAAAPVAPPCPAAPPFFAFQPPVNVPLQLHVLTERPARSGQAEQFQSTYRLLFRSEGRGFRLTMTMTQVHSTGQGRLGNALAAMLAPLVGRPIDYLIGSDGQTLALQNSDQLWDAVEAEVQRRTAQTPVPQAHEMSAMVLALPPLEREAMLTADIRQMLRFAGLDWTSSFAPSADAGRPDCALLTLVERPQGATAASHFTDRQMWRVDVNTGLVSEHRQETDMVEPEGDAPHLVARTLRTLQPE